ncbi:MAG: hypothetical protein ACI8TQ_003887 [Planctomycetota bacterium]
MSFQFTGTPGDLAILNLGLNPTGLYYPGLSGSGLLELPLFFVRVFGTVPPGGPLTKNITLNELGPGIEGVSFYAQGSFANASGISVGGGSLVVLLDDSI